MAAEFAAQVEQKETKATKKFNGPAYFVAFVSSCSMPRAPLRNMPGWNDGRGVPARGSARNSGEREA
jgi:hypothetical protein